MSKETLILKTAVTTNSTVKLTDCPMSSGEILEMVCRLYANGLTSGNRCFKAIGNAVTYNTDAVTEGDIYCVSYRDGGFYVGLRTTEDYEPKEGDWWCYVQFKPIHKLTSPINNRVYTQIQSFNYIYNPFLFCVYFNGKIGVATTLQGADAVVDLTKDTSVYQCDNVTTDGLFLSATPKANQNYMMQARENGPIDIKVEIYKTPTFLMFHKLTASDILAYQATKHMGWLMFGEELEVSGNTNYNANKQFRIKNNVKYAVIYYDADNNQIEVDFATLNRHGAKCTIYNNNDNIYNIYATEKIGTANNAIYVYQLDFESHYQDGVMERQITSEKRVEGETGAYHHIRVFPIIQDNRPATLNALNANLLNSNQTDVQPIND